MATFDGLAELGLALERHGYRVNSVWFDDTAREVIVQFPESAEGRVFAGSLLMWGIPRRLQNNKINAEVWFPEQMLPRVVEILSYWRSRDIPD